MNKLLKFSDEAKQQNQNKRKKLLWQKFVKSDKFCKMGHFLCRKVGEEVEIQQKSVQWTICDQNELCLIYLKTNERKICGKFFEKWVIFSVEKK